MYIRLCDGVYLCLGVLQCTEVPVSVCLYGCLFTSVSGSVTRLSVPVGSVRKAVCVCECRLSTDPGQCPHTPVSRRLRCVDIPVCVFFCAIESIFELL